MAGTRRTRDSIAALAALTFLLPALSVAGLHRDVLASPTSQAANSPFGVVITAMPSDVPTALRLVGAARWYAYGGVGDPSTGRAEVVRPGVNLSDLAARARAKPGGEYLVGNEPNVPGQDDLTPTAYADFLASVASALRTADPTSIIVGPNVLNWDTTCTSCAGFPAAHGWSDQFVTYYQQHYGALPLSAWGAHVYNLDWDHMPLINAPGDQAELAAVRTWLSSKGFNLPLWLTEFGIIWGYTGIQWVTQPDGVVRAEPGGPFRSDLVAAYIDQMMGWLTSNRVALRIDRWYLYALIATPENYTTVPGGIGLMPQNSLTLTSFGQQYRDWVARSGFLPAAGCSPRPAVGVSATPAGAGRLQVTITAASSNGVTLQSLSFGSPTNAVVDVGTSTGVAGNTTITLPSGTGQTTFFVRRVTTGQAATMPVTVTDTCGDWPTFVGGGPGAF